MKKIILGALAFALTATVYAEGDITVSVNGKNIEFDQPPVIDNDRTLVPMRAIFEALGAQVDWDGDARTVTSKKDDIVISLTIDSALMKVGDKEVTLDVPAKIISDRTMVPVRAISEAMECRVDWQGDTRSVIITTEETAAMPSAVPEETAAPTEAPAVTAEPTAAPTENPFSAAVKTDIPDDENIFDLAWIIEGKEMDAATGKEKENAKLCVSDYVPVNEGKTYYAGYYDPNNLKYQAGYCYNYAFYDANKKYISGAAADMSKTVKAPDNASFVRFTIKLEPPVKRAPLYLTFMQTEKAPETFKKSKAVTDLAQTDKFAGKRIFIVGDQQIQNSGAWASLADRSLGAEVVDIKGIANLRYVVNDYASMSIDKTTKTFPNDMDYMIVCVGFYDWMNSYSLGSDLSSSGGIYDFLEDAGRKWPKTKLVLMTLPVAKYATDGFTDAGMFNKRGMSTMEYSDEIKEAAERYNTEVIDISDLWDKNQLTTYMKESNLSFLYPNEEGGKLIAQRIYDRMLEIADK